MQTFIGLILAVLLLLAATILHVEVILSLKTAYHEPLTLLNTLSSIGAACILVALGICADDEKRTVFKLPEFKFFDKRGEK